MLSYSVYFETKRTKMVNIVYRCWVHVCVFKIWLKKVPSVIELMAKQHRGHFYGTPCICNLVEYLVQANSFSSLVHYFYDRPIVVRYMCVNWLRGIHRNWQRRALYRDKTLQGRIQEFALGVRPNPSLLSVLSFPVSHSHPFSSFSFPP